MRQCVGGPRVSIKCCTSKCNILSKILQFNFIDVSLVMNETITVPIDTAYGRHV